MHKWYEQEWPYWVGALVIAGINIFLMAFLGEPWGLTSTLTQLAGSLLDGVGLDVDNWSYFMAEGRASSLLTQMLLLNLGVICGSCLSSLLAGQFRIRYLVGKKYALLAVIGGLLMGFSSRLAPHCNVGAVISGIPSFSVQGWVFAVFVFLGAAIGSKIIYSLFE